MKQKNIMLYGLLVYGGILYSLDFAMLKARKDALKRYRSSTFYMQDKKVHDAKNPIKKTPAYKTESERLEYDNILYKDKLTAKDKRFLITN